MTAAKYLSIFSPASRQQRQENFESYWLFTQQHGGELFEDDKDLAKKRARLKHFQDNPVKLRQPIEVSGFGKVCFTSAQDSRFCLSLSVRSREHCSYVIVWRARG